MFVMNYSNYYRSKSLVLSVTPLYKNAQEYNYKFLVRPPSNIDIILTS